jgi:hypothetical protein
MSKSNLTLAKVVRIRQSGARSINVESDLQNNSLLNEYVFTGQSRSSLERMLVRFEGNSPARSWTLTGPYGSGKSYYGLFLMNLMGTAQPSHRSVLKQLRTIDPILAGQVTHVLNHGSTLGLLPIPVTGFRASLQECIKHGLRQSLGSLRENANIKARLKELEHWNSSVESRSILQWLRKLTETLREQGYLGALMVFDELGKPLEYAASHPDITDIYLLQELAEFANRSGDAPFVFVSILHQAFERYAAHLDSKTQREWAKVQGRFEDIAFQEPPTQQLRLLAKAIEYLDEKAIKGMLPSVKETAEKTASNGWCPPMLKAEEFTNLAIRSFPFHPTSLIALPYLFKRLAQNERSIFAYLASHEPAGFQDFISKNTVDSFVRLPDLFDYLSANFQGRLYATGRARAITETMDRLSNVTNPELTHLEANVLKTIGLLNWLAEVSHLHATESSILDAMQSQDVAKSEIHKALQNLQSRSLIVYRRFNKTYSIWQGSDVDIEERLQEARQQLSGSFSIAEAVQKYLPPRPIVARRHSYTFGVTRYFEVRYLDAFMRDQARLSPAAGGSGIVLVCLAANPAETERFAQWAGSAEIASRTDLVIGILEKTGRLTELLSEIRALHWVHDNTGELHGDPVARRELRTRFSALETLIQNEIEIALSSHRLTDATLCKWIYKGKRLVTKDNEGLSHLLSKVCDDLYDQSPVIWNEIINRRSISSQGAAARRNLIEKMLTKPTETYLGIEGFPPERSIYDSLLKASGLHREVKKGQWEFVAPKNNDPLSLLPAWREISQFVFNETFEPRRVAGLFKLLSAPPYGITDGILPILLCVFLIIHRNETTLYREGSLLPDPSIADWEVLLRRPELFSVAGCRITGTRQAIVERFARGYQTDPAVMPVVRVLIRGLKSLPEHTWRTNRISHHAQGIRAAVDQAKSPERLLFSDLPLALELEPFEDRRLEKDKVDEFFSRLSGALTELSNETPRLLEWGRDTWLTACGLGKGDDNWSLFRSMAVDLIPHVTNPTLLPLLKRAAETDDNRAALESVLAYIANRPYKNWTDIDTDVFSEKVVVYAKAYRTALKGYTPEASLSHEQRKQSRTIADTLRQQLKKAGTDDSQVLRVALQMLLQEMTDDPETKL